MPIHIDDMKAMRLLLDDLQKLESRAHRLKATLTAHAINRAKNTAGWEMAGNPDAAAKASRGEMVG